MLEWPLIYLISEWIIRLLMIPVVTHRCKPNSAMAWLLIIFFEPWIGFILYILIGENRLPQRRIREHVKLIDQLRSLSDRFKKHPQVVRPDFGPEMQSAINLAERLGYMPIMGSNTVELIDETQNVIDQLVEDINSATHHVHLLFYIFQDDSTGRQVTAALKQAVDRGVKCRLLVDAVGSSSFLKHCQHELRAEGILVEAALPVKFFRRKAARIDLRNHRKIVVIDGHTAYTGSQNIVDSDYGRKGLIWHDLMLRIQGPVTLELQTIFLTDWYFETNEILDNPQIFPDPIAKGEVAVQTLPSGPNFPTENYQRMVLAMLHAARKQVIITTPYFIPDEALLQAIQVAVLRGVDVTLILPAKSDQVIVGNASKAYYESLLEMGANLFLFNNGLLHSKTISIDSSISMIGSSNFDIRSFELNFEITMMLYGTDITEKIQSLQEKYLNQSQLLTLEEWNRRPKTERLVHNMMRLLSPLL